MRLNGLKMMRKRIIPVKFVGKYFKKKNYTIAIEDYIMYLGLEGSFFNVNIAQNLLIHTVTGKNMNGSIQEVNMT